MSSNDSLGWLDLKLNDCFVLQCPKCRRVFRRDDEHELVVTKNPSGIDTLYCPDDGEALSSVWDPAIARLE